MEIVDLIVERNVPKGFPLYDVIFKQFEDKYPTMSKQTWKSYTESAIKVLRQKGWTG